MFIEKLKRKKKENNKRYIKYYELIKSKIKTLKIKL